MAQAGQHFPVPIARLLPLLFLLMFGVPLQAQNLKLDSFTLKDIEGQDTSLHSYAGKVLLIVNVASECGYTPQYEGLEALWRKYRGAGLVVLGFPSNDFGEQEPGTNEQIKKFCSLRYHVSFPMFEKIQVVGPKQHPLYRALGGEVSWNFNKFLVGRDGAVLGHFDSDVEPDSSTLLDAIAKALEPK